MDIITVQKRDTATKAKHLRRSGLVPGNIFGGMLQESISIQMDEVIARKLLRVKREGSKLRLALGDQVIPVQIKEKMQNTLSNEIVHISFQALKEDQKVNSVIHILLKNMDKVAGIVERILPEIPYASLPADMIDTITIDLEGMQVGSVLTVGDIPEFQNEKIDLQVDTDSIVLRINDKTRTVAQVEEEA
ncbi:50S ribosomal protein L25/general stress protein Ctc [Aminipila butyrica]|uniref:50S ribosomal protein L25/general stress protein Ctc n=1 Tax=Aminipila butyrica TaxID=433296 RepID=A0A858BVI6_9FIRM|nr:50S ribosomal protein L25/general stress protein Ctc [Aminipila butyrica]QIB69075.1 50S ribosomal protein L25/general stress protein Ctc [Aminipila butyrica]